MVTSTPSKVPTSNKGDGLDFLLRKYYRGEQTSSEWIDTLLSEKLQAMQQHEWEESKNCYLLIDLFQFDFPIVFNEKVSCSD
jgi:phosphatidylinositol 3-kinase